MVNSTLVVVVGQFQTGPDTPLVVSMSNHERLTLRHAEGERDPERVMPN